MNVTMSMLLAELNREYSCREGEHYNPDKRIDQAFLVDADAPAMPLENSCYVATRSNQCLLVGIPYDGIILGFALGDSQAPCAIQVVGCEDACAIQNAVRRIIARYEIWESDLLDLALHGAGLEELLDCAHGMFENPMTIIDDSYRLWAQTDNDKMDDILWVADLGVEQESQQFAQELRRDEEGFNAYLAALGERGLLENYTTSLGTTLAACTATSGVGATIGVNVIEKNRPITHADIECLKYFSRIVGSKTRAIEFTWQDSSQSYYALLQDVIRGNLSDSSEFKARLSRTWINLDRYFTVFIVSGRQGLLRYHQLCRIEDELSDVFDQGKSVIAARTLVIFVNHDRELSGQRIAELERYATSRNLAIGMSESRSDECSLRTLYEQAQLALRVQKRAFPDSHIVRFDACRSYYLYDLCSRQEHWEYYLHDCLLMLKHHDESSAFPLLPTLRCLVKHHGNRTAASKELGIQRNSLQYRLSKIEEICSVDLSDPGVFDDIAFSVGLHDYCTNGSGKRAPTGSNPWEHQGKSGWAER